MKIQDFSFLTDENIDNSLVAWLRNRGNEVWDIKENQLWGMSDSKILTLGFEKNLVVISQDSDFGTLVFRDNLKFYGIIYLRPGHQNPLLHIETLDSLFSQSISVAPPFIIIGENRPENIRFRIREIA